MDRIVIEVDDNLANHSINDTVGEYLNFLKALRNEVAEKGLTQDALDEILGGE